jgi:hypothetical protein
MDKDKAIIVLYGVFFVGLFLLSLYTPESERSATQGAFLAENLDSEDAIRAEQQKYFRSRAEDEAEYYKSVQPKDMDDDPDFFDRPHPLEEKPLQQAPLQEESLDETPLEENPLQEKLLR